MNSPERANSSHTPDPFTLREWGFRLVVFLAVTGLGTFVDLYSKSRVFANLGYPNGRSEPLFDTAWLTFRLHTSFNRGALWGIGQNYTAVFAVLSVLAIGVILYWLFVRQATRSWWLTICLALILAGTLGNLYDRLGWHGCRDPLTSERIFAVRDFLLFRFGSYHWPVFNFADVFLVSGACCLILQSLLTPADRENTE